MKFQKLHLFTTSMIVTCCSTVAFGQTVLQDRILEWTASTWGNGFGHRIYAQDPGNRTLLNIAARHNSVSWTNMVSFTSEGNVGIGTTHPLAKLAVDGNILAKEIKIKTNIAVPDYVFEPDYALPTLAEVEAYVREHKHLPEIPSAKDIEQKGLDLAEMNLLLLKKVEELTLYIIQQQIHIEDLTTDVQQLKQHDLKTLLGKKIKK